MLMKRANVRPEIIASDSRIAHGKGHSTVRREFIAEHHRSARWIDTCDGENC
jgi:hypothetical protein